MNTIIETQGIHHITLNGTTRETSIKFWQDILGMRLIFEQPNLDNLSINHLFFDCGDDRLISVFTDEKRLTESKANENKAGSVHHIAFWVSQATITAAEKNLRENGFTNSGIKDRGFMDSLYFRDPLGLLVELSSYKFHPPAGSSHAQVLEKAHKIRSIRGAVNIEAGDISEAIRELACEK